MSLFICAKCGCVDNTATSEYWGLANLSSHYNWGELQDYYGKPLCSECAMIDRKVSKGQKPIVKQGIWHGLFKRKEATILEKNSSGENGIINL